MKLLGLSDTIYQMGWYRYSRSARLCVQLMIMRSQRPFYLSAHGVLQLKLENYVWVSASPFEFPLHVNQNTISEPSTIY